MVRPRFVDLQEIEEWEHKDVVTYSNQLGDQCWEMIGPPTINTNRDDIIIGYRLVFKRQK